MNAGERRIELGDLIGDIARTIEYPECFAYPKWQGISYPAGESIAAANVREFQRMLEDARQHCLALPRDESVQRALETIEYAALAWELFTEEWLAENDDDHLLVDYINAACQYAQEGCSVPLRTLAAKLIAAGRLGEHDTSMTRHDNGKISENKLPESPDVYSLCKFLKEHLADSPSITECARQFCRKNNLDESRAENLLRGAYRYRHLWEP